MKKKSILVVEDDNSLREALKAVLEIHGFEVCPAESAEDATDLLREGSVDLILSDFLLPGENGLELLKKVRAIDCEVPFVIMTAYGTIDIAVEAMKFGANDFITKPFDPEALCGNLNEVLKVSRIVERSLGPKSKKERVLLTKSPSILRVVEQAKRVALVDSSVLILGESGTGKELIARLIHDNSSRRDKPFVAINCGAVPAGLLESELFGHEEGSFTGATQRRMGLFEYATDGTIFLDEIGDMPPQLQVKLLRVLQEKELKRVGGTLAIKTNARIVSATNCNIKDAIKSGRIREDFYYRIAVIQFKLSPLRERPEDIELLAAHFLEYFSARAGKPVPELNDAAKRVLASYSWPGNARELENIIERAVILSDGVIKPGHLGITSNINFETLDEIGVTLPQIVQRAVRKAEEEQIKRVLAETSGNKTKAAKILGVSYKTLLVKVKEYNLDSRG